MTSPSVSQWVPDPLKQVDNILVPISTAGRVSIASRLFPPPNNKAFKGSPISLPISAGNLLSPIIIDSSFVGTLTPMAFPVNSYSTDNYYFTLPTAYQLIGAFGGTSNNGGVVIPGGSFMPLRQNNSINQVQIGDTFIVPVINLNGGAWAFVAGIGGTVATSPTIGNSLITNSLDTQNTTSNSPLSTDSMKNTIVFFPYNYSFTGNSSNHNTIGALTFIITEIPNVNNPSGSYTVY